MSPAELNEYLCCMRANNVMSGRIAFNGVEIAATFGPEMPADMPGGSTPGGWKTSAPTDTLPSSLVEQPSDPDDPDPLKLGQLDVWTDEDVNL